MGHSNDFREGALLAVNLGEDADTTGAVYGQLAGAYYGEDGIASEWRARITRSTEIADLAALSSDFRHVHLGTPPASSSVSSPVQQP